MTRANKTGGFLNALVCMARFPKGLVIFGQVPIATADAMRRSTN
ncbi:hypothetical protein BCEP4_170039 [Burkholderia cepacia]|nr:hypothetical protein BCEP4_170039 [Burkholderia cepacia]